jgi:c-di-GMP-related signal transduction protein
MILPDKTNMDYMNTSQISPYGGGVDTQSLESEVVTQVIGGESSGPVREEDLRNRFLSFEPIFDHQGHVVARELVLRGQKTESLPSELAHMNEDMLLTGLYSLTQDGLTGEQPLFVQVSREVVFSDVLEQLAQPNLVWILKRPDAETCQRARELAHSSGLKFCLDTDTPDNREVDWAFQRFIQSAHVVAPAGSQPIVRNIHRESQLTPWGDGAWFMGEFFTGPRLDDSTGPDNGLRLELVTVAMRQPLSSLVQFVHLNPGLESQLLRIAGSIAGGLSRSADSSGHALIMLGRQRSQRITILTALSGTPATADNRLFAKIALSRALIMGKLAYGGKLSEWSHHAFEIGLLSTLPVALSISVNNLHRRLGLSSQVAKTLAGHDTPLRPLLQLAHACERNDTEHMTNLARELDLSLESISAAQMEALVTAEDMDSRLI